MRRFSMSVMMVVLAIGLSVVAAQDRVARAPSTPNNAQAGPVSQAQAALDQAATANKYAFVFFWKDKNPQTDKAFEATQAAAAKFAERPELVSVKVTDPAEKPLVDRLGMSRAPLPMVLAIAPCGAVTKGITATFDESQFREAFVSPCTANCIKALQAQKLVLLCVQPKSAGVQQVSMQKGVKDFTADPQYAANTKVLDLDAGDSTEAKFLADLKVDAKTAAPVTVLIAPPAAVVGAFTGEVTKNNWWPSSSRRNRVVARAESAARTVVARRSRRSKSCVCEHSFCARFSSARVNCSPASWRSCWESR